MSEQQATYGAISTEALAALVKIPEGWRMVKHAIYTAASEIIEAEQTSIFTAMNILDNNASQKSY